MLLPACDAQAGEKVGQTIAVNSEKFLKRKKVQPHEKLPELIWGLLLLSQVRLHLCAGVLVIVSAVVDSEPGRPLGYFDFLGLIRRIMFRNLFRGQSYRSNLRFFQDYFRDSSVRAEQDRKRKVRREKEEDRHQAIKHLCV